MAIGVIGIIFLILGIILVLSPALFDIVTNGSGNEDVYGCLFVVGIISLFISLILLIIQFVKLS